MVGSSDGGAWRRRRCPGWRLWLSGSPSRPSLTARPNSRQNVAYFSGSPVMQVLDRGQHLLDQAAADHLDVPVLLQDLPGDVQRQVGRVHHALDEAQVVGHQLAAVVHDEHALDVELQAAAAVALEQVVRGAGRDEEQGLVLEGALRLHVDDLERVGPVVADVPVELVVLLVVDLRARPRPERLHRVERVGRLAGGHPDRERDEVGVLLDDLPDLAFVGVVEERVLLVGRPQVHGDRGARPARPAPSSIVYVPSPPDSQRVPVVGRRPGGVTRVTLSATMKVE